MFFGTKIVPKIWNKGCPKMSVRQFGTMVVLKRSFGTMIVQNAYLAHTLFQINDLVQKLF